jgi:hypothetical protein
VHTLLGLLVLGLVCTIGLSTTGCKKKEEEKKGGGDTSKTNGGKGAGETGGAVVYKISKTIIVLKPGEKQDVELTREGKNLKGVTVKGESSEKAVHVKTEDFKDDEKAAKVTIHADEKAPPGKHTVTLTADDTKKTIEVEVKGKAKEDTEPKKKNKEDTEPKKNKEDTEPKKGKDGKGAMILRPQGDAYVALGREELQAAAPSLTRRQAAWFIREF